MNQRKRGFFIILLAIIISSSHLPSKSAVCDPPNIELKKTYGGSDHDRCYAIIQASDGGYLLAGNTRSFDANVIDVYVVKIGYNEDIEWTQMWGGSYADTGFSVQLTDDDGYIICGTTQRERSRDEAAFLLKLNKSGDIEWNRTYYDKDDYQGRDGIQTR